VPVADRAILQKVADTVRVLSAEAVEKAASGHPGLPMGCAELGTYLFARQLRHNPANPRWMGRDRFVLSAGHGSMLLYSLLHLSGYDLSLDQLKNFRQLHSQTPGHPEYGEAPGVETTTGPLGQGVACGVGMAIAQKWLRARFGEELFNAKIWVLVGDGCMMEGVGAEAGSLAGHLRLENFVLIYDSNDVCLDGPLGECLSEDTAKRFEAYGFRVLKIDGHDFDQVADAFDQARAESQRPTLIVAKTTIGKGAPHKQGTSACHGSKLGADELAAFKQSLGWTDESFYIPAEVKDYFKGLRPRFEQYEAAWNDDVAAMKRADPEKARLWDVYTHKALPEDFDEQVWRADAPADKATRAQSQRILQSVAELAPFLVGGSADLSVSDLTAIKGSGIIGPYDWAQRNIKFGVREFCMAAACYGMSLHGMVQPLCGTFLTFSDYMRNAIRLCSIMRRRVFFQFTHDSIFLGEDGPTHQPIEHLAALRAIPNLTVIRPCDEHELKAMWIQAFKIDGPVAFILTRQGVKSQGELTRSKAREGLARGGYVLYGEPGGACDGLLIATGSEIGLAMDAARLLEREGKTVRVVSMPSCELFDAQEESYRDSVLGGEVGLRVSIEAGAETGWHKYVGRDGLVIGLTTYGASAPGQAVREHFGFTPEKIVERIESALASR